eukprot:5925417-Amphidinium_carterae.1
MDRTDHTRKPYQNAESLPIRSALPSPEATRETSVPSPQPIVSSMACGPGVEEFSSPAQV